LARAWQPASRDQAACDRRTSAWIAFPDGSCWRSACALSIPRCAPRPRSRLIASSTIVRVWSFCREREVNEAGSRRPLAIAMQRQVCANSGRCPTAWRTVQIDRRRCSRKLPVSAPAAFSMTLTTMADTVSACVGNISILLGSAVPKSWNWRKSRPFPVPGPGEVRIKVLAAGRLDRYLHPT
jgi:hypothetical protein